MFLVSFVNVPQTNFSSFANKAICTAESLSEFTFLLSCSLWYHMEQRFLMSASIHSSSTWN